MKQPAVSLPPTITDVQYRFSEWRKNKKHRERIPENLWVAAVMLSQDNTLHKISRTLGLSYTDLKKRVASSKTLHSCSADSSQDFIPIDIAPLHTAECIIEMEHRNGNKMRMHFKGKADLELQSFAESFWSGRV